MLDALKALGSGFVLFILARLVFVGVVGIVVGTVVEMVGVCRCRLRVKILCGPKNPPPQDHTVSTTRQGSSPAPSGMRLCTGSTYFH